MKLLDTMVIVGAMNPADKHHKTAMSHLRDLQFAQETYIPTSSLTEFDLVLRNSGYTEDEISETWAALAPIVGSKFLATTPTSHLTAARIRIEGLTYFDSLIAALAKEMQAVVVTKDAEIAKHVETQW